MKENKTILDLLKNFSEIKVSKDTLDISWETISNGEAFDKHPESVISKWIKENPYSPKKKK